MNNTGSDKDPRFDWPYATSYLLETLDPELIEAHAEHILSRSLNIGRTVAFIGAGVAMSYGRISWQTLVQTELRRVNLKLERAKRRPEWNGPKAKDAKRLSDTLDTLRPSRSDIRPERYPMLFQISEQLDGVLDKFLGVTTGEGLRTHAARLTIDDVGHAYQILLDALCYDRSDSERSALRTREDAAYEFLEAVMNGNFETALLSPDAKRPPSVRQGDLKPADGSVYRLFFDTEAIEKLFSIVDHSTKLPTPMLNSLRAAIEFAYKVRPAKFKGDEDSIVVPDIPPASQPRSYLLPTDRYLIGVLLHLADSESQVLNLSAPEWWKKIAHTVKTLRDQVNGIAEKQRRPPEKIAVMTRHGLVTQWRDPLLYMQERLRISRFITTNFDHEIERLFRDQSFRTSPPTTGQDSLMRRRFQEIVFQNGQSGELTAFAVQNHSLDGAVVHLHGRAEKESGASNIVITETDYQKRYLRADANRKLVDDAIRLAFGSSPILFVGSNMGEDDLLRPLRQFMSGPARVGDRVAIALVPAMNDRARRTEDKIALLGRYGVYAIHFGNCRFWDDNVDRLAVRSLPNADKPRDVEWLPWYWSLQKSARDVLKFLSEKIDTSSWVSEYEAADQAWNRLVKLYHDGPDLTPAALGAVYTHAKELVPEPDGDSSEAQRASVETVRAAEISRIVERERDAARCRAKKLATIDTGPLPGTEAAPDNADEMYFRLNMPKEIEGKIVVQGGSRTVEVTVEIHLITAVLNWLNHEFLRLAKTLPLEGKWLFEKHRTAKALLLALDGAGDSVLAIFTCARLEKVKRDWNAWKDAWFNLPTPARIASALPVPQELKASQKAQSLIAEGALTTHRHQINMPEEPGNNPGLGRFYRGAPSQSLFGLTEALERESAQQFRKARGRRLLILSTHRGLGKGHFFSSIEDCKGCQSGEPRVLEFLHALNPRDKFATSKWLGLGFMGLTFSQEVMSAFDRMIALFYDCLVAVNREIADSLNYERLERDRTERLRAVLAGWAMHGKQNPSDPRRVLLAFNGFSNLFDREGREKNGQIKKICDLIFSNSFNAAPLDFVLLCQNSRLPMSLIGPDAAQQALPLLPERRDAKARARAERTLQEVGIGPRSPSTLARPGLEMAWHSSPLNFPAEGWQKLQVRAPAEPEKSRVEGRDPAVAVHVLTEARAIVIAAAYFPRVATLIARDIMWDEIRNPGKTKWDTPLHRRPQRSSILEGDEIVLPVQQRHGGVYEKHGQRSRDEMRVSFNDLQSNSPRLSPKNFAPVAIALLAMVQEFTKTKGADPAADLIRELRVEILKNPGRGIGESDGEPCLRAAREILCRLVREERDPIADREALTGGPTKSAEYLCKLLPTLVERLEAYMRNLFELVHGGRFLLTLIFSAAYEATSELTNGEMQLRNGPFNSPEEEEGYDLSLRKPMEQVASINTKMIKVLANVQLALKGVAASAHANGVIEEVLSTMRRRADRDEPLPIQLSWTRSDGNVADVNWPTFKPLLHKLMMEVVWHLSIIGQPVEQPVLEHCPRIIAACAEINKHFFDETQCIPTANFVEQALALATNRCLIFRLVGNPEKTSTENHTDGSDETERFTVHRLMQSYVFRSLGAASSEFADADQFTITLFASQPDDLPRLSQEAHREISKVIAALSDYPQGPNAESAASGTITPSRAPRDPLRPVRDRRRRLRATLGIMRSIYSVAMLSRFDRGADDEAEKLLHEGFFEEHRRKVRWLLKEGSEITNENMDESPFYAEEVVWLCNECAVLSMVEGRLADAQGLFTLAMDAVRRIEPNDGGPLHVRLLLNRSVCDIERGHTAEARNVLELIAARTDEHEVPPLLATGYLGLIDHLAGEFVEAERRYIAAIDGLAELKRSRAASIFSRHFGDMLGRLHHPRVDEGIQRIENAIHFAQEGGHEDVRYLALLSLAKLHIRRKGEIDGAKIHKELDAIEAYGRVVGMPRIQCEISITRARLLLRQGETERAGSLVNESLEIASMNDMRLRKVSGLLLLAEINLRRNHRHAARPLLALGIQMAKSFNSHSSLTHAQSLDHQLDAELGAL